MELKNTTDFTNLIKGIDAVVVWYNPTTKEADNIHLYANDVNHVIIVDNSDKDNAKLVHDIPNAIYLPLMKNLGIATALNKGCKQASELGAQWVLTMDQDSRWDQHSVKQYIQAAQKYENSCKVAIYTPFHDCDGQPKKHKQHGEYEQRLVAMCSGNLLRIEAWKQVNGFRDDFYIDSVDDEICCHLRQKGWTIIRLNNIYLTHHLGEGIQYVAHTHHKYTPHVTWRYYYIARNIHRMMYLYPDMRPYYKREVRKYIKRLCLYDWQQKIKKLSNFRKGWNAYMEGFIIDNNKGV